MESSYLGKKVFRISPQEGTSCSFCPERGGIIYDLQINGKKLLYLDEKTFQDNSQKIHGGIPFLFPIAGKLKNSQTEFNGKTYTMGGHGFARDYPFTLDKIDEKETELSFYSTPETRALYPFFFEIHLNYYFKNETFIIDQEYRNLGSHSMPIHFGFHPYFLLSGTSPLNISGEGTSCVDYMKNNEAMEVPHKFIPDTADETNWIICQARSPFSIKQDGWDYSIQLDFSDNFNYIVMWGLKGKPFFCVEPWSAFPDAMNTRKDIIWIEPEKAERATISIALTK